MARVPVRALLVSTLVLGLSILFVACSAGQAATTPPQTPHVAHVDLVSTVETTYYDTAGATSAEILESARANGPTDGDGNAAVGLATQKASLETKTETDGEVCWLSEATVTVALVMTLPRYQDIEALAPAVRQGFERWSAGIATHEQRHVDIYLAGAGRTKSALESVQPAADCAAVAGAVQVAWDSTMRQTEADQEAFHAEDRAREAAARAPLAARVDANRERLDGLSAQVASFDAQLDALRRDLESAGSTSQYNALVSEHNAIVVQRNALVEELNTLADETDALIDQLNWTT